MRLVIAEKPSMGRAIAEALGINGSGRECIKGKDVIVTWAVGHLVEPAAPNQYGEEFKNWDWASLPILPDTFKFEVVPKTKSQYYVIEKLLKSAEVTEVVNACDSGREGQLICNLILDQACNRKPVMRLWTASLTEEAIQEAWKAMKPDSAYAGYLDAAHCRQESDWLIGMNATRGQTLVMRGKKGYVKDEKPYSIGRVQTPTLAILYQRHQEISNFKPKDFWTVLATFDAKPGVYQGQWFTRKDGKILDRLGTEAEAAAITRRVLGKPGRIASYTQTDKKNPPQPFYDLTTLQKMANKRFGYTAEDTLGHAQALYEAKVTSYPRTGSRFLTEDVAAKLPGMLRAVAKIAEYGTAVKGADLDRKLSKRFVDASKVEDHHAILPTGEIPSGLTPPQKNIYDLIVRRAIAAFYPDQVVGKTEIITVVGEDQFKTNGSVVKAPGWTAVDSRGAGSDAGEEGDEEADKVIPPLKEGINVATQEALTKAGKTTPPKPMTEADLLDAMETAGKQVDDDEMKLAMKDCGLGTPATRASIIETLLKREYLERKKKILSITSKGIELIEGIEIETLKSPAMTGEWEAKLSKMNRGGYGRDVFMREIREFTRKVVENLRSHAGAGSHSGPRTGPVSTEKISCPKCEKPMPVRTFDGRHYVKCECGVSYDTDASGQSKAGPCAACGKPLKTTKSGKKVCSCCGTWAEDLLSGKAPGSGGGGVRREKRSAPQRIGSCPKCEKGTLYLKEWEGRNYVQCATCKLAYDSDESGMALGGNCRFCKGPVKVTQNKSKICVVCEKWQDEKTSDGPSNGEDRPPKPPPAKCALCHEALKIVYAKTKKKWLYRCDTDNKFFDPAAKN